MCFSGENSIIRGERKNQVSHTNFYYCGKPWSKTKRSSFRLPLWGISSAITSLKNKIPWNSKVRFLTNVRDPPSRKNICYTRTLTNSSKRDITANSHYTIWHLRHRNYRYYITYLHTITYFTLLLLGKRMVSNTFFFKKRF